MNPTWLVLPIFPQFLQNSFIIYPVLDVYKCKMGASPWPLRNLMGRKLGLENYSGQGTIAQDQAGPFCLSTPLNDLTETMEHVLTSI